MEAQRSLNALFDDVSKYTFCSTPQFCSLIRWYSLENGNINGYLTFHKLVRGDQRVVLGISGNQAQSGYQIVFYI